MIVMIARIGKIWNELKNVYKSYKIPIVNLNIK